MTELRQNPTQPAAAAGAGADPDPLHNLYRMSLTAGLGSGEYVAINNTSILALLLGLASVLALLSPVMLVVVAAAVVCGVLALVQIRSSNGTQTGQVFAAIGILLGLVFGGVAAGNMTLANMERRQDERRIAQVVKSLNDLVTTGQYTQAYQTLFTERFKTEFPEDTFVSRWELLEQKAGRLTEISWGERAEFDQSGATLAKRGQAIALFRFDRMGEPSRLVLNLVEQDGEWMIDAIGQLFDEGGDERPQQPDPRRPQGPEMPSLPKM